MLKNSQGQILQQKLSPQAIQAQLLLAIPTIALEQEIKKQLEDNPVLEDGIDADKQQEQETGEYDNYETEISNDNYSSRNYKNNDFSGSDEDRTEFLINKQSKARETPLEQVYKLGLSHEQLVIAGEILGNLEDDG